MSSSKNQGGQSKKPKAQKGNKNAPKITTFFSLTGISRSNSKTLFKTNEDQNENNDVKENEAIQKEEELLKKVQEESLKEYQEQQQKAQELKEKPKLPESFNETLQKIYEDDTESNSDQSKNDENDYNFEEEEAGISNEEEIEDGVNSSDPVSGLRREQVYQLPQYEVERWKRKVVILKEFKSKSIKTTESAVQKMIELQRLLPSPTYRENVEVLKQYIAWKEEQPGMKKGAIVGEFLPKLASLALEITNQKQIAILTRETPVVSISKLHVAALLANMFFTTLASVQHAKGLPWGNSFKMILAGSLAYSQNGRKFEKLKCLCHYFERIFKVQEKDPEQLLKQCVTFERIIYSQAKHQNSNVSIFWKQNKNKLTNVVHEWTSSIEDFAGTIHVDFANEYIGGGVLDHGLVQEEIRFLVSPELIVSRLISPKMEDNEAVMILGTEQFSKYEGYSNSFKFMGDLDESGIEVDSLGRKRTSVLAIDAINYGQSYDKGVQFKMLTVVREILKAYIGFEGGVELRKMEDELSGDSDSKKISTRHATGVKAKNRFKISTGRWGCGIFNGDPQLKFLIQWIVASEAKRDMIFCSFEDKELTDLEDIVKLLEHKTIGDVFSIIHKYTEFLNKQNIKSSLFQFIKIIHDQK